MQKTVLSFRSNGQWHIKKFFWFKSQGTDQKYNNIPCPYAAANTMLYDENGNLTELGKAYWIETRMCVVKAKIDPFKNRK